MSQARVKVWCGLALFLLGITFASLSCGSGSKSQNLTGCYVNGAYYPNGNAPNDQCVCPVVGPCSIVFPALLGAMSSDRQSRTGTLLPTGQILLTGGRNGLADVIGTAALYDPQTRTPIPLTAAMTTPRVGHAATRLLSGQVLLTGGKDRSGTALNTAEIYDSVRQSFTALTATMTTPRAGHTAALLFNGQVLLRGGQDRLGSDLTDAELFDPVAGTFTTADDELWGRLRSQNEYSRTLERRNPR